MIQKTIEKLSFRSFKENIITIDEIEKYVGFSKEYNNFSFKINRVKNLINPFSLLVKCLNILGRIPYS